MFSFLILAKHSSHIPGSRSYLISCLHSLLPRTWFFQTEGQPSRRSPFLLFSSSYGRPCWITIHTDLFLLIKLSFNLSPKTCLSSLTYPSTSSILSSVLHSVTSFQSNVCTLGIRGKSNVIFQLYVIN